MTRARPDRKGVALGGTAIVVALVLAAVWALGDPVWGGTTRRGPVAIAIRDNVSSFEKYGTKLYTKPILERAYDRVVYITDDGTLAAEAEIRSAVAELAAGGETVDVFFFAHANGYVYYFQEWLPHLTGKIGLVYNTGCGSTWQAELWGDLGARAYVSHPGTKSMSPVFLYHFLRRWTRGDALEDAVGAANELAAVRLRVAGTLSLGTIDGDALAEATRAVIHRREAGWNAELATR